MDKAATLKAQQDALTVLRAAATSTSRVARARVSRQGSKRVIQRRFNMSVLEATPERPASTL